MFASIRSFFDSIKTALVSIKNRVVSWVKGSGGVERTETNNEGKSFAFTGTASNEAAEPMTLRKGLRALFGTIGIPFNMVAQASTHASLWLTFKGGLPVVASAVLVTAGLATIGAYFPMFLTVMGVSAAGSIMASLLA